MTILTVPWRSFCFYVVSNWFICTYAKNYEKMIVLCCCGIPPNIFSMMPDSVINVHHLYQLPDCLDAVSLEFPLVALSRLLVMIPKKQRL